MSPKGTFIGLNTIDIQFIIDDKIKENSKYKSGRSEIYVGGPATNAAICFSHLGGNTKLLTPVGDHHFTNFIYDDIKNYNIDLTDLIQSQESEATIASIITTKENGNRTVFSYHPKEIERQHVNCDLDGSDVILVDGFYNNIAIELMNKKYSAPVVLDGGSWKPGMDELLKYIDIAICSEDFSPPGTKSEEGVFSFLHDQGIEKVAITKGEKPIQYSINNSRGQIYVESINAVDTLGAGDFFHGAFCYYFALDSDFVGSLLKASKIAGESCKFFGTREWLKERSKDGKNT